MRRKILAMITLVCFMFTLVPVAAMAEDSTPTTPVEIQAAYDWYTNATGDVYEIDSIEDLAGFAKLTQGAVRDVTDEVTNFAGKTVKLAADLTFADNQYWYYNDGTTVYDYRIMGFAGTFDGAKSVNETYTITGLKFYSTFTAGNKNAKLGLFSSISGSVKNLTLDTVTAKFDNVDQQQHIFGSIAYELTGSAANCHVKNVKVDASAYLRHLGGMFSHVSGNSTVTDCTVTSVTITSPQFEDVGGFAAVVQGNARVTNCAIDTVKIKCSNKAYKVGGFIGRTNVNSSVSNCNATNITISVPIQETTGGFVGHAEKNTGGITGCNVSNVTITAITEAKKTGGFTGEAAVITLKNCNAYAVTMNIGDAVTDNHGAFGGFVGQSNSGAVTLENCHLYGLNMTVYGTPESSVGGFITATGNSTTITNCSVEPLTQERIDEMSDEDKLGLSPMGATIDASNASEERPVGGFLGDLGWGGSPVVNITDCNANVDITAKGPAGGFVARAQPNSNNAAGSTLSITGSNAYGDVLSTNGAAGGFIGVGSRGNFEGCVANGSVTGVTAGGFCGEIVPNNSSATVKEIVINSCEATGTVLGATVASGFVGSVTTSGEGDTNVNNVKIENSIATPIVDGLKPDTVLIGIAKETIPEGSTSHYTGVGNSIDNDSLKIVLYGNHEEGCTHTSSAKITLDDQYALKKVHYGDGTDSVYPVVYDNGYQHSGHTLNGWFTENIGGSKVINADGTLVSGVEGYTDENGVWLKREKIDLYAQWEAKKTTITLDANADAADLSGGDTSVIATYGQTLPSFEAPEKTHTGKETKCHLAGWYTQVEGGVKVLTNEGRLIADIDGYSNQDGQWSNEDSSVTLYAHWNHDDTPYYVDIYKEDLSGGTYTVERHVYTGYKDEPVNYTTPSSLGIVFNGFTFNADYQDSVLFGTVTTDSALTLKLYYDRNSHIVTLNTNEGIVSVSGAGTYKYGQTVEISAEFEDGYKFLHWDISEGVASDMSTNPASFIMPDQAVSFQPHAEKVIDNGSNDDDENIDNTHSTGSSNTYTGVYNYPVNIVEADNGALKADRFSAVKGETVIVTATPDNGFGTAKVIVTDGDGDTIAVTDLQNGTYSFVMPEGKVSVTAVFKDAIVLKIGDNNMNVFGKTVANDVAPQIKDDYTMLPIRPVVEALDGDVAWDADTQKITVKLNGNTVVMYVGEKVGYINGAATEMDVPSYIDNSRALYQLRFVAEATGTDIHWNKATYEVTLIPE